MPKEKEISYTAGHRERLREKFTETRLVDTELMELLLTYAFPRIDVKPIVKRLMAEFGDLHSVLAAPIEDLKRTLGIGPNAAILLKLVHEIMGRDYSATLRDAPIFHNVEILHNYLKNKFAGKQIEEFHVLYLDGKHKLIDEAVHAIGTINEAQVYPREILKRALNLNAASVVLAHNHPSGDTTFSTPDITMTEKIRDKLALADIEFFDHFLVSGGILYSMKNLQVLNRSNE